MYFLLAVLAFAGVTTAFLFVERLYRSPTKPRVLQNDTVSMLVCVGFTGAFAGSFGAVLSAAFLLPLPIWGDVATAIVVVAAAALAVRYIVRLLAPPRIAG